MKSHLIFITYSSISWRHCHVTCHVTWQWRTLWEIEAMWNCEFSRIVGRRIVFLDEMRRLTGFWDVSPIYHVYTARRFAPRLINMINRFAMPKSSVNQRIFIQEYYNPLPPLYWVVLSLDQISASYLCSYVRPRTFRTALVFPMFHFEGCEFIIR